MAASAAALAGGGTSVERLSDHDATRRPSAKPVEATRVKAEAATEDTPPPAAEPEPVAQIPTHQMGTEASARSWAGSQSSSFARAICGAMRTLARPA